MSSWIEELRQQLNASPDKTVTVSQRLATSCASELKASLACSTTREILPPLSAVNFRSLLAQLHITPSPLVFLTPGISPCDQPDFVTSTDHFLANQDEFWLAGGDLGVFDESLSWVLTTGDDGQTMLTQPERE